MFGLAAGILNTCVCPAHARDTPSEAAVAAAAACKPGKKGGPATKKMASVPNERSDR